MEAANPPRRYRLSSQVAGPTMAFIALVALFGSAGTVRWPAGWAFVVLVMALGALQAVYVSRRNPELRRNREFIGEGTKAWDRLWLAVFWPMMLNIAVVSALDAVRFRLAPMSPWLAAVGVALLGGGFLVSALAMGANPFFEGTARIQRDRGQKVIDAGPYRRVRHPGYLALCLIALGIPWVLGSWWGLVPAAATAVWIAIRARLEDEMLRRELDGYRAYAQRVRFRLVPGLW